MNTPGPSSDGDVEVHRLCLFDLSLTCGHIATVVVDGWYPVSVACCERLGGTVANGIYRPYNSEVEYVDLLSERYEERPRGVPREPTRVVARRPRTDDPRPPQYRWEQGGAGRFPARVGATLLISGPPAPFPRD